MGNLQLFCAEMISLLCCVVSVILFDSGRRRGNFSHMMKLGISWWGSSFYSTAGFAGKQ